MYPLGAHALSFVVTWGEKHRFGLGWTPSPAFRSIPATCAHHHPATSSKQRINKNMRYLQGARLLLLLLSSDVMMMMQARQWPTCHVSLRHSTVPTLSLPVEHVSVLFCLAWTWSQATLSLSHAPPIRAPKFGSIRHTPFTGGSNPPFFFLSPSRYLVLSSSSITLGIFSF